LALAAKVALGPQMPHVKPVKRRISATHPTREALATPWQLP
jgi:hypothetical protein